MEAILGFQDVLEVIQSDYEKLIAKMEEGQAKEIKRKNYKALFILHQYVDTSNYEKISRIKNAKEAWDTLEQAYAGADKVKKVRLQTLKRQYALLGMEATEGVGAYIAKVQALVNQMKNCGEKVSDQSILEKILRTLPSKFDVIAVSIKETKDLERMKIEELQGSLEAYEQRINERGKGKDQEQVLQARESSKNDGGADQKFKKGKAKWLANKNKWQKNKAQSADGGGDQKSHKRWR